MLNCTRRRRTGNRHLGQRHLDYLKQYRKVTYTNLLTSGRLNAYLADINRQAQERFERLIEGMKQAQGITEQLKAENALEWTGCLNNIRACAREIVEKEIIFAYADDDFRAERGKLKYHGMSLKELNREENRRKQYYEFYTGQRWGDPTNYDMMINTSGISLETAANTILAYIQFCRG